MSDILMKCRHSANCEQVLNDGTRIPACAICNCNEIAEDKPDLTGRRARCAYYGKKSRNGICRSEVVSKYSLPFFEYKPDSQYDEYYCGCWGWD